MYYEKIKIMNEYAKEIEILKYSLGKKIESFICESQEKSIYTDKPCLKIKHHKFDEITIGAFGELVLIDTLGLEYQLNQISIEDLIDSLR